MELLFKRFKQRFCITTAKAGSKRYAETMILLQLIIWVIVKRQAFLFDQYPKKKTENEKTVYST